MAISQPKDSSEPRNLILFSPSIEAWMLRAFSVLVTQDPTRVVLWVTSESELLHLITNHAIGTISVLHRRDRPLVSVTTDLDRSVQRDDSLLHTLDLNSLVEIISVTSLAPSQERREAPHAPPALPTDPSISVTPSFDDAESPSMVESGPITQLRGPSEVSASQPISHGAEWEISADEANRERVGSLVVVIGPGGAGVSSVALAISEALSRSDSTLLIDAQTRPEIGFLLNLDPATPGLSDLLYASPGEFGSADLQEFVHLESARFMVLPGVRSPKHKELVNGENVESLLTSASATARYVVVDSESDSSDLASGAFYGATGRSLLNRAVLERASRVVLVCDASPKGLFSFGTLLRDVVESQIALPKMDLVINRSPDSSRRRREIELEVAQISAIQGLEVAQWNLHVHIGVITRPHRTPQRLDFTIPERLLTSLQSCPPLRQSRRESYASVSRVGSDEIGLNEILNYFESLPPFGL